MPAGGNPSDLAPYCAGLALIVVAICGALLVGLGWMFGRIF